MRPSVAYSVSAFGSIAEGKAFLISLDPKPSFSGVFTAGPSISLQMAGTIGLAGYAPYNMAKEAVRALTRTAAREWGVDKITVNNVLPVADTWGAAAKDLPAPTNALGRFGSPEDDIAPVVLFLASKDSQFITGYSLTPDGGSIIDSAR